MQFKLDEDTELFREEVRTFLQEALPSAEERERIAFGRHTDEEEYLHLMGFQRRLAQRKWFALAWPKEYGGGGANHIQQLVFNEEMAYHRAPAGNVAVNWVGPSLMLYGTDEQKQKYIPGIAAAEHWWCTLYSEPGAGSDLAALQTRAVRDGDDFVINGQKIWTSAAHLADWGWLAARTDPDAPKHKGISMFLVNMRTPGITIRPLVTLAGKHHFNEVFFDDVRIPQDQLVGTLNRGWYQLAVALDFERSSIGSIAASRRVVDDLVALAKERPELLRQGPSIRTELAARAVEVGAGTNLAYRVASMQSRGLVPNVEASASKLYGTELSQRVANTAMHMLGMAGQLRLDSPHRIFDEASEYMGAIAATIAGGTSEVQRGIMATRGLGLPRG